jgi:hypothetical protein
MPADGISLPPTDFGTSRCGGSRLSYINGTVRPPPNGGRTELQTRNRVDFIPRLPLSGGSRLGTARHASTHCRGAPGLRSTEG